MGARMGNQTSYRLGIVGFGNMGGAILSGALSGGILSPDSVQVYDVDTKARERAQALGANVMDDDAGVCEQSDIILIAVKPQQLSLALEQCGSGIAGKAVLSIVAGVGSTRIRERVQGDIRLLRLLPNTPALVGAGAFALCSDNDFHDGELRWASRLFAALGTVELLPEYQLDAVCGLSGGGPAYAAMFIEALADGGVRQGLARPVALRLAAQTCFGTAKLILERGMHPADLKDMVTSPAGTTIEGCAVLEDKAFRSAVIDAVSAAAERSAQL